MIKLINDNSKKKTFKEARELTLYTFDELNDAQQQYVVDNAYSWSALSWIYEFFDEAVMESYAERLVDLADDFAKKYGLSIDCNKVYWQSNSHGPYPEWRLDEIFEDVLVESDDAVATVSFSGRGMSPSKSYDIMLEFKDEDGDWFTDYGLDVKHLSDYDAVTPEFISKVENVIVGAQEFIDSAWELINDTCQQYPDEEYIHDELENSDSEFVVIDDERAKPYV